jgi:hypothetical protein
VESVKIDPPCATLGSVVTCAFDIVSESAKSQDLVVDYVVYLPGVTGKVRSKVWKLRRIELGAKQRIRLEAKVSLVDRTIRKHYAGAYRIDLRVGGTDLPLGTFDAVAAPVVTKQRSAKARHTGA